MCMYVYASSSVRQELWQDSVEEEIQDRPGEDEQGEGEKERKQPEGKVGTI